MSGRWMQDWECRWRSRLGDPLPIALASFTIGANWALNFDRFRELAPQVVPEVVQSFLLDA